jgi:hypothetical protein
MALVLGVCEVIVNDAEHVPFLAYYSVLHLFILFLRIYHMSLSPLLLGLSPFTLRSG